MYSVAVRRAFVTQHYLVGGDFGAENEWHSHHYRVEVRCDGPELDEHGFLVDIDDLRRRLEAQVVRFRDHTLNDDPAFAGLNPSVEHFARILAEGLGLGGERPVTVTVWENEDAWASYRLGGGAVDGAAGAG